MKSLLEQVEGLDYLIRQVRKMASKLEMGQIIPAFRECNRMLAALERNKRDLIMGENNDK